MLDMLCGSGTHSADWLVCLLRLGVLSRQHDKEHVSCMRNLHHVPHMGKHLLVMQPCEGKLALSCGWGMHQPSTLPCTPLTSPSATPFQMTSISVSSDLQQTASSHTGSTWHTWTQLDATQLRVKSACLASSSSAGACANSRGIGNGMSHSADKLGWQKASAAGSWWPHMAVRRLCNSKQLRHQRS
jgi:hypothetical protein